MNYEGRKITVGEGGICEEPTIVQRQHLDSNNHVNNAQYISIALRYLPEKFRIGHLRVEYKKQAHLGDVLIPYVIKEEDKVVVSLRDGMGAVYVNIECRKA
jgi:acyl-ACP thioesterase